jgi:organic radical activating enzyme
LKVIIYNKHDFIFAEEQAEKIVMLFYSCSLNGAKRRNDPLIVMNNPKWRVSLQTHKYLNIP